MPRTAIELPGKGTIDSVSKRSVYEKQSASVPFSFDFFRCCCINREEKGRAGDQGRDKDTSNDSCARRQIQGSTPIPGVDHYSGMLDCFRKIVANEGASRLYRGISAPILMEAPKRATKFAANDEWGKVYRNLFGVDKMNQSLSILTGATAGATEAFVVVPFELVKIRLQDRAQAAKYNGMLDAVAKIVSQEGIWTLYQGLESTMWRHMLWNAGYFGCIFQVRAMLPANPTKDKSVQMRNDLLSGAIGGTVGTILNTPMDVVKSRIQNSPKVPGGVPKYGWAWPALGTVMREEGFGALYKGFAPKVLRLGPGGGILLVVFTGVMDFFRGMRAEKEE
nr:putative mitochondrial 2-oxodicarboxylate carrier [Quercus suber]